MVNLMKFYFVTEIAPYRANNKLIISGGGEAHIFFIARELAKRGHEVKIITGRWRDAPAYEIIDKIEIIRYGRYAPWFEGSPFTAFGNLIRNNVSGIRALETAVKKDKPDFIVTSMTFAFPRALFQSKIHSIPLIAEVHDIYRMSLYLQHYKNDYGWLVYLGTLYVWIYNNLPRYANLIETVSFQNIAPMVKQFGVKKAQIAVTGNGIDMEKYSFSSDKESLILVLGRLVSYKRVDVALNIFKRIRKQFNNVRMVIAGDGPERKKLESLAIDHVEFLGFVSEDKKIELLKKAKIVLSCSEFEGFGIVPIEGLACGAYPVLSNLPAHIEVVGHYGFIFNKIDDAVERITQLLSDDNYRFSLSLEGRKFVESVYTWNKVCDNFLEMINSHKHPPKDDIDSLCKSR
jgi:glycosyltransferase involved in cell wall biosynthesis